MTACGEQPRPRVNTASTSPTPKMARLGYMAPVFEGDTPVLMALRLKVDYGLIKRNRGRSWSARAARRAFSAGGQDYGGKRDTPSAIPALAAPAERLSREALVMVANAYFTGLGGNTGRNTAPFAPTCLRWGKRRPDQ